MSLGVIRYGTVRCHTVWYRTVPYRTGTCMVRRMKLYIILISIHTIKSIDFFSIEKLWLTIYSLLIPYMYLVGTAHVTNYGLRCTSFHYFRTVLWMVRLHESCGIVPNRTESTEPYRTVPGRPVRYLVIQYGTVSHRTLPYVTAIDYGTVRHNTVTLYNPTYDVVQELQLHAKSTTRKPLIMIQGKIDIFAEM